MINALTGLGYSIIGLALTIGIGIVILATISTNSVLTNCPSGYTYNSNGSATFTVDKCCMSNGTRNLACVGVTNATDPGSASTNVKTLYGYLGTDSGGLASWVPIIIVLVIGMMFLGAFLSKKGMSA